MNTDDKPNDQTDADQHVTKLRQEKEKLKEIVNRNFPGMYKILMACLSVKAQMLIQGITLPFFLILVGKASGSKTTVLGIVDVLPDCFKTFNITSKSFVSHMASVSEGDLSKIDLLPKIKNKTLVTPELGTLFSTKDDKLSETLGMLASILDGRGYKSESGARGTRGYDGEYYFTWLGAIPKLSPRLLKLLADLGPKIYFLDIDTNEITDQQEEDKILEAITGKSYPERLEEVRQQVKAYWEILVQLPWMIDGKISWNCEKDDQKTIKKIVSCAILLSKLRVPISYEKTFEGIQMEVSNREFPSRAATLLLNLAKGSAVLDGRNFVTDDDLQVVLDVALSSAFKLRTKAFKLLLENGEVTTLQVMGGLKVSRQTALNTMKELIAVELAEAGKQTGNTKYFAAIRLRDYFRWMLEDQYKMYWKTP